MDQPLVSIIILACNKCEYTKLALDGLLESTWNNFEIIVLDNGSVDDTPEMLERFRSVAEGRGWRFVVLRRDENVGAVEGRNIAVREARGEYVVFMDNDIVVGVRSWVERLLAIFEREPDIGVLGLKIVGAERPNLVQCAGCIVSRTGRVGFMGRGEAFDSPACSRQLDVQALISACWIMPKKVMDEVGELDMKFHPVQFEDIDYCYRVRVAGYRAVYTPDVFAYHFENVTTDGTEKLNYRYLTVRNGLAFKRKWAEQIKKENGPADEKIEWVELPRATFADVGELKIYE